MSHPTAPKTLDESIRLMRASCPHVPEHVFDGLCDVIPQLETIRDELSTVDERARAVIDAARELVEAWDELPSHITLPGGLVGAALEKALIQYDQARSKASSGEQAPDHESKGS